MVPGVFDAQKADNVALLHQGKGGKVPDLALSIIQGAGHGTGEEDGRPFLQASLEQGKPLQQHAGHGLLNAVLFLANPLVGHGDHMAVFRQGEHVHPVCAVIGADVAEYAANGGVHGFRRQHGRNAPQRNVLLPLGQGPVHLRMVYGDQVVPLGALHLSPEPILPLLGQGHGVGGGVLPHLAQPGALGAHGGEAIRAGRGAGNPRHKAQRIQGKRIR